MKTNGLIITFVLFVLAGSGQGWEWKISTTSFKILNDQQENLYVISNGTILKVNSQGTSLWSKSFPINMVITAYKIDQENNLIIIGNFTTAFSLDTFLLTPKGQESFFILKLSPQAEVLSVNVYGSIYKTSANDLFINQNGEYVIAGSLNGNFEIKGDTIFGDSVPNALIFKIDSNQNLLWYEKSNLVYGWSSQGYFSQINEVVETTAGTYYAIIRVEGYFNFNGGTLSSTGLHLIKLDSLRNFLWKDFLYNPDSQWYETIDLQSSGDTVFLKELREFPTSSPDALLHRWVPSGTSLVSLFFGGAVFSYEVANGKVFYSSINHYGENGQYLFSYRKTGALSLDLSEQGNYSDSVEAYGNHFELEYINDSNLYIGGHGDGTNSYFVGKFNFNINCSPIPVVSNATVCANTSTTLFTSGTGTLGWYNQQVGGTYLGGGSTFITPSLTATTTFYVQDSVCFSGAVRTPVTVTVLPLPTISINISDTSVCSGTSVNLTGIGASSFSWSDSIINGVNFLPAQTHSYTVIGTDTNNCSDTASITITVHDPVITAYATSTSLCQGHELTLTGVGAVSYSWSNGISDGVPFVPDSTTTYTVVGTDQFNCTDSSSIIITVHPLPTVSVNIPDTAVCLGSLVTLTASGANTYFWTDGISNGIEFFPAVSNLYIVTGTDVYSCSDTASISITVNSLPLVIPYASATHICEGTSVPIIGTGAETYQWSDGIINGVSFTPTSTNTYTVIGTDENNCSDTASITITVTQLPDVTVSLNGATLTANQAQADYQWLNCDEEFSEILGATGQSYSAVENGNYAVIIDLDGCVDTSECVAINNVSLVEIADGVGWIKVFPNPSSGKYKIYSSESISSITITNLFGEEIHTSRFIIHNSLIEPDISSKPNGIYFLEIVANGKKEMKKIIVQ